MTKEEKKAYFKNYYNKMKEENPNYYKDCYKKYYEKNKEDRQNYFIKWHYNITREEYNELFNNQEGKCAICGRHQSEINHRLCVDHDHATQEIRGLLCKRCNTVLGQLNILDLSKIFNYLKINFKLEI